MGTRHELGLLALSATATACVVLGACAADDPSNPYALDRKGTKVEVTPIYRACDTDADCTLMDITCDICCVQDAVTASLAEAFDNERMIACADYAGPVCSCIYEPMKARCNEGRCAAIPRPRSN